MSLPEHIDIWTDGGIKKNPGGIMGASFLLLSTFRKKRYAFLHGNAVIKNETNTNNIAELLAVIWALQDLKHKGRILVGKLFTDSNYVYSGIVKASPSYEGFGHSTNKELWDELEKLCKEKLAYFAVEKVKGHSGVEENELVDSCATWCMENRTSFSKKGLYEEIKEESLHEFLLS